MISCNNPKRDWESAKQKNTIDSYKDFINKHPNSEFTSEAKKKLLGLEFYWKDGFLEKKYYEDQTKIESAFQEIVNPDNAVLIGFKNIEKGSIKTFAGSYNGKIKFTEHGAEGMIKLTIKQVEGNGFFEIGFKINDVDSAAAMSFHQLLIQKLGKNKSK